MALIYRNGRPYSYRSIRKDGRVTSEYRGAGEIALLIERMDGMDREGSELERSETGAEREPIEADEQVLSEYFDRVEDLARAALLVGGCYQHKREWRRRRVRTQAG